MNGKPDDLKGRILAGCTGLLAIAWFFVPVGVFPDARGGITALAPFRMPLSTLARGSTDAASAITAVLLFAVWLVPLFGVNSLAGALAGERLPAFLRSSTVVKAVFRIIGTGLAIFAFVRPLLVFGDNVSWYRAAPLTGYLFTALAIVGNIAGVAALIQEAKLRDPVYREYHEYRAARTKSGRIREDRATRASMGYVGAVVSIRTKIIIAFVSILAVTILVLVSILLGNYRSTILSAVGDDARNRVEQISAAYKVNLGDPLAMLESFNTQIALNRTAGFRFSSLVVYANRKAEVFADAPGPVPDFPVEFSSLAPNVQYPPGEPLAGALAARYGRIVGSEAFRNREAGTWSFVAPVFIGSTVRARGVAVRRERILGFSVITFSEDEILKPYFRTRSLVIVLTALFLYLGMILAWAVGNYIVNPLLYLRMNVRKISETLRRMIRGESRVRAGALVFNDAVSTRDEIKSLSGEISDMVTVIRGIVPYISESTLRQAGKGEALSTEKELAFLFTDIRGFTSLCEGMRPEEVVGILNRYLDLETQIILDNHGDVDKFVGDEMMAFFDGPEKELNACRAALLLRRAMEEEGARRERAGLRTVQIGIGINTGPVVFGSVGARERMDFTSIGDTVNLAARLEGANKEYRSRSIITEAVHERVKGTFLCRELDFIAVKGKTEPVRIYEIMADAVKAPARVRAVCGLFAAGLAAYRARRWDDAGTAFRKAAETHQDGPSAVFLDRVRHFASSPPPADWDGVFRMTVK